MFWIKRSHLKYHIVRVRRRRHTTWNVTPLALMWSFGKREIGELFNRWKWALHRARKVSSHVYVNDSHISIQIFRTSINKEIERESGNFPLTTKANQLKFIIWYSEIINYSKTVTTQIRDRDGTYPILCYRYTNYSIPRTTFQAYGSRRK